MICWHHHDPVKSQCRLFADDCLLYNEIETLNDSLQLQKYLKLLENWAEEWGMKFNANKCYIISTEKGGIPFFYTLNDHILQYVGTNPYLGVTLSEDLTFDAHVGNITKKKSRMLGFIQRNLKGFPSRLKELAYLTLVRSGLGYASVVWDPFLQREIDRLEKIKRRAARFVTNNYRRGCGLTSTQLIDSLGWDSLQERRKTARLCMLYKAILIERQPSRLICCVDLTIEQGAAHKNSEPFKQKRDRLQIITSLELYRIGTTI